MSGVGHRKNYTPGSSEETSDAALALYREGRLCSGLAAKWLGESRAGFLHRAFAAGIPPPNCRSPVDIAEAAAIVRAELTGKGIGIGEHDAIIAAHARALGLICVTDNQKHFSRVRGLTLENWRVA